VKRDSDAHRGRGLVVGSVLLVASPLLVRWAWNLALPVLGAPRLDGSAALGLVVLVLVLSMLIGRRSGGQRLRPREVYR